ncbi:MAG: BatD family protein, partial [Gammaproteobacteria bacterium]
ITVQGEVDAEPDFKPLESVVEILGRNRQTSIQWINGKHTRTNTWMLDVIAKRAGALVIPALAIGSSTSPPLTVETEAPRAMADEGLFLEVDATPRDPYVQQEVIYTIRLWRRFELSNASLSEPRLSADAIVRPLGDDRHLSMEKNGKPYEVIERRFALFPQTSGQVDIAPAAVTAQVVTRASSLFELFGRSVKTRRVAAPGITLQVRPIPVAFPAAANWLPARRIRLNETWEPATLSFKVGEPLTRTLTLWAEGMTSGQLPNLALEAPPTVKVYPNQPELQDDAHLGTVTAVHQEKIALIPSSPGPIDLPPVEIPWWNTVSDRLEIARLPARTLTAAPGSSPVAPITSSDVTTSPQTSLVDAPTTRPLDLAAARSEIGLTWSGWFWVAIVAGAGWLATGVGWWRDRVSRRRASLVTSDITPSQRAARAAVLAACRRNDAVATRRALMTWAATAWPDTDGLSLSAIAAKVPEALASAIHELNRALYQQFAPPWE